MRKSIMYSCILAVTLVLGIASQAFADHDGAATVVTAKLKCDAQLKLSDAQICTAEVCLDVVEELNVVLDTNFNQIQKFKLDCAQAISATVVVITQNCDRYGGMLTWLVPPSSVPSASGEIVNMTALCRRPAW